MADKPKAAGIRDFPFTYWIAIIYEFFERGSYYGVMSILSVYLTDQLGFSKEGVGTIKSTIQPILYILPILTGAIADRLGFKKTLLAAFGLLGLGYFLTSQVADSYALIFFFLIIMALGAGTFKPVISGTIAKVTDSSTSTLGFGIFYWTINLGAFLFPTFLVPWLKGMDWSYIFIAAAIGTGAMIIPTLFIYREPPRDEVKSEPMGKVIKDIFKKVWMVTLDWRFILFIFIYSWFWIMYFQMFDATLWYFKMFVDPAPINGFMNSVLGMSFAEEHVTSVNAFTIITLQLLVSSIVKKTKPLPTMLVGIGIGTLGLIILSLSQNFWFFLIGIITFSLGEMTAHPKYISYLGLIAPPDKKATYMGFGFLYGFFGSLIAGYLGANLYVRIIDNPMIAYVKQQLVAAGSAISLPADVNILQAMDAAKKIGIEQSQITPYADTSFFWLVIAGIGTMCILGLLAYHYLIGAREASDLK